MGSEMNRKTEEFMQTNNNNVNKRTEWATILAKNRRMTFNISWLACMDECWFIIITIIIAIYHWSYNSISNVMFKYIHWGVKSTKKQQTQTNWNKFPKFHWNFRQLWDPFRLNGKPKQNKTALCFCIWGFLNPLSS